MPPAPAPPSTDTTLIQNEFEVSNRALITATRPERQRKILEEQLLPDVDIPRSPEELRFFESGNRIVELFDSTTAIPTTAIPQPLDEYPTMLFRSAFETGKSLGYLEMTTDVRASALDIVSMRFDTLDWETLKLVERVSAHHVVALATATLPPPFLPRQFLHSVMWRKVDIDAAGGQRLLSRCRNPGSVSAVFQFVVAPTTHVSVPESSSYVRGSFNEVAYFFEYSSSSSECLTYVQVDPAGDVPKFLVNRGLRQSNAPRLLKLKQSFQARRRLVDLEPEDGKEMGESLLAIIAEKTQELANTPPPELAANHQAATNARRGSVRSSLAVVGAAVSPAVSAAVDEFAALRETNARYPWFEHLLSAIVENVIWIEKMCSGNGTELDKVTPYDASQIGRTLNYHMNMNNGAFDPSDPNSVSQTVSAWVAISPALVQLSATFPWFEPMIGALVKQLANGAAKKLWRVRRRGSIGIARQKTSHAQTSYFFVKTLRNTGLVSVLPCFVAYFVIRPWIQQRASKYYGDSAEFVPPLYGSDGMYVNVTVVPIEPGLNHLYFVDTFVPEYPNWRNPWYWYSASESVGNLLHIAILDPHRIVAAIVVGATAFESVFLGGLQNSFQSSWAKEGELTDAITKSFLLYSAVLFLAFVVLELVMIFTTHGLKSRWKIVFILIGFNLVLQVGFRIGWDNANYAFYGNWNRAQVTQMTKVLVRGFSNVIAGQTVLEASWQVYRILVTSCSLSENQGALFYAYYHSQSVMFGRMMQGSSSTVSQALALQFTTALSELFAAESILKGETPFYALKRSTLLFYGMMLKKSTKKVGVETDVFQSPESPEKQEEREEKYEKEKVEHRLRTIFCSSAMMINMHVELATIFATFSILPFISANLAGSPGAAPTSSAMMAASFVVMLAGKLFCDGCVD